MARRWVNHSAPRYGRDLKGPGAVAAGIAAADVEFAVGLGTHEAARRNLGMYA